MPIEAPRNANLLDSLGPKDQAEYRRINQAMARVEQRNPGMNTGVYTAYLENWLNGALAHQQAMEDLKNRAEAAQIPLNRNAIQHESVKIRRQFMEDFMQNELPRHGKAGQFAFRELGKEMDTNVLNTVTRNVYDPSEGGIQWGGIIGAVLGGMLGFMTGGGLNSWVGIAALAAGILGGSWLGNKAGDWIGGKMGGGQAAPGAEPQPVQSRQPQQQLSPEAQRRRDAAIEAATRREAERANQSGISPGGTHVDDGNSAQLPPPPTEQSPRDPDGRPR